MGYATTEQNVAAVADVAIDAISVSPGDDSTRHRERAGIPLPAVKTGGSAFWRRLYNRSGYC